MAANVGSKEYINPTTGERSVRHIGTGSLDASGDVTTDSSGNPATKAVTEELGQIGGERNVDSPTNNYDVVHNEVNFTRVDLSAATPVAISSGVPAFLCGLYVDTVLSAHAVTIGDSSTVIATIPASTAVGAFDIGNNGHDIRCETDITLTPNAASTGILLVYWRPID